MSAAPWLRRLRLLSGFGLMAFVACHLTQLALGLVSLHAIEAFLPYLTFPWETPTAETFLALCVIVHSLLGLQAIAARRSLVMSTTDIVQALLALSLPPLLLAHILLTRMVMVLVPGFIASYGLVLALYWSYAPALALQQLLAVVVVWVHGAIGIYSRLALLPSWRHIGGILLPLLFAVPILALLGFVHAGNEVLHRLAADSQWRQSIEADLGKAQAVLPQLAAIERLALLTYGVLAGLAVVILLARLAQGRTRRLAVAYDDGSIGTGRRGLTILEISELNGIPHAHVCSGRARCGTCRVEVEAGADQLSPMTGAEHDTLAHVHAATAGVRLACQARVLGPGVRVRRLLPAFADASAVRAPEEWESEDALPAREAVS